jgi:hypothetical protein
MGTGDNIRISGADLCGYCTVLEGQIHLTNTADGSPVDEKVVYNHHILTNGPAIPFPLKQSGINLAMSGGFVGAGGDNGNSPFMYYNPSEPKSVITGYQMKKSDSFSTQIVLVNKSSKQQSISVNYELEYIPWDPQAPKPIGESVQSALISASVMPNSNGKSKSNVMTWTKSGTFIFGKGHLREYLTSFLPLADGTDFDRRQWQGHENVVLQSRHYSCHWKGILQMRIGCYL